MPGFTATDRLNHFIADEAAAQKAKSNIPMGRFGTPEKFACAAAFLVSESASYITGQSLAVDGGLIRGF